MRKILHRSVLVLLTITMAACTSVDEDPNPNPGGSGGTAGSGGSAGTGGTAGGGGAAGSGGSAGEGGIGGMTAPTVDLQATPGSVAGGTPATLSWTVTNATSCVASGAWEGARLVNGPPEKKFIYDDSTTFILTCEGPSGFFDNDDASVDIDTSPLLISVDFNLYLLSGGDAFDLDVTVSNPSRRVLTGVVVRVPIPQYVIIAPANLPSNAICSGGTCEPGQTLEWVLGALASGRTERVSVTPTLDPGVPSGQTVEFAATASADGEDDTPPQAENITEGEPRIALDFTQSPMLAGAGDSITYTLDYSNATGAVLPAVQLVLALPGPVQVTDSTDDEMPNADGVITWLVGDVAIGESSSRSATVAVDPDLPLGAPLRASALAVIDGVEDVRASSFTAIDDGTAECTLDDMCAEGERCVNGTCEVPLLATITVDRDAIVTGNAFGVSVTVTNGSNSLDSEDVEVRVPVPAGLASITAPRVSAGGTCVPAFNCTAGESLVWSVGTLAPGESRLVSFEPVAGSSATPLDFTATVSSRNGLMDDDTVSAAIVTSRTFNVRVLADKSPAKEGDLLTYSIHYANASASTINSVTLELDIPDGATLVNGSVAQWDLGRLQPGEGGVRQSAVTFTEGTGEQLRAQAAIFDASAPSAKDLATVQTAVGNAPLLAFVEAHANPVRNNRRSRVSVTVTNPSTTTEVNDVEIEIPVPPGLAAVQAFQGSAGMTCPSPSVFNCSPGERLVWKVGDIGPGEYRVVSFEPSVTNATLDGTVLVYQADIRANSANAEQQQTTLATDASRVLSAPTFNLQMVESANPAMPGDELTYTIHYANREAVTINDARLQLLLPANASLVAGNVSEWDLGRLQPGDSGMRQASVTLTGGTGAQLRAEAVVFDVGDPGVETRATVQTPIGMGPLQVFVEANADPVPDAFTQLVSVTVTNPSPANDVNDVEVEVPLPPGLFAIQQYRGSAGMGCQPSFNCVATERLVWNVGDLGPLERRVVSFEPETTAEDGTLLLYEADVRANAATAAVQAAIHASATAVVQDGRVFDLRMVENANPVAPGDALTYTLHYANQSDATISDARLELTIPGGATLASGSVDTWMLGTLQPGDGGTREATITFPGAAGTQLRARARIYDEDNQSAETRATVQTPIGTSRLLVGVEVNPDPSASGTPNQGNVSITVTNSSDADFVNDVEVEIPVPQGLTAVPEVRVSSGGTCPLPSTFNCTNGERLVWDVGDLAPLEQRVVSFEPILSADQGAVIVYEADVRGNAATASEQPGVLASSAMHVQNAPNEPIFNLRMVESANPIRNGEQLTYTLHYGNRSASTISAATLRLRIPEESTLDGGSVTEWSLGTLQPGDTGVRTASVTVTGDAGQQLRADAIVFDVSDPAVESRATVQTPISDGLVRAEVVPSVAGASPGDQFRVTLVLTNESTTILNNIAVRSQIPAGLNSLLIGSASPGANCETAWNCTQGEYVEWTGLSLGAGQSTSVDLLWFEPTVANATGPGTLLFFETQVLVNDVQTTVAGATIPVVPTP